MQWLSNAACRGKNIYEFFEGFESASNSKKQKMIEMCASCQVKEQCFDYALSRKDTEGFWAGYYWRHGQRRNPYRLRGPRRAVTIKLDS